MSRLRFGWGLVAGCMLAALAAGPVLAQGGGQPGGQGGQPGGQGGQPGGQGQMRGFGGPGGQFDPAQMREWMVDNFIYNQIAATEEEWTVMRPLILKVLEKQSSPALGGLLGGFLGGGRGLAGMRGPGGAGGPGGPGGRGMLGGLLQEAPETTALREAVEKDDAKPEDIKPKLQALRDARKKAEDELQAAREELRKVCSVRQEAQLVLMGLLN